MKIIKGLIVAVLISLCATTTAQRKKGVSISKDELRDKIKGGWAGQAIGVTFGWPTEFVYQGTYMQDYETIPWRDTYVVEAMDYSPGLYDDIYVDLTFVDVMEKHGIRATAAQFGEALAASKYHLWHANQAARYNLRRGISPTQTGHWLNNPHADDIDFQIEADFIGIMSPGLPEAATELCDRVGRLMNSGDGLYGGIFVSHLYANAFTSKDIGKVIDQSIAVIPKQSKFYQCIADVIKWHKKYPKEWKRTWFEIQNKWSEDIGCPQMVFHPLNIDAKLNSAYVVLGLLYGEGDFKKTLEISTRAGQDSDCNPATAAGILGVMVGYSNIPAYWLDPVRRAEDKKFNLTEYTLAHAYDISYKHALENLEKHQIATTNNLIHIPFLEPKIVSFEENFKGHYPHEKNPFVHVIDNDLQYDFNGIGMVLKGYVHKDSPDLPDYELKAAFYIDDVKIEEAVFPTTFDGYRPELFWKYQLKEGNHKVRVEILNKKKGYSLRTTDYITYSSKEHKHKF